MKKLNGEYIGALIVIVLVIIAVSYGVYREVKTIKETHTVSGEVKSRYMWAESRKHRHEDEDGNTYYTYDKDIKYSTVIELENTGERVEINDGATYRKYKEGDIVKVQVIERYYKGKLDGIRYKVE